MHDLSDVGYGGGEVGMTYLTLVMVDGYSKFCGSCVVTPISSDPAHFATHLSSRTSSSSPARRGRAVSTTPWLKSSWALHTQLQHQ